MAAALTFEAFQNIIKLQFGESVITGVNTHLLQPSLTIQTDKIADVCKYLHQHPECYFDFLTCVTGLDNGPETATVEVIYHLYSIPFEHRLTLKVVADRNEPKVPSVTPIWGTANWYEREAYDMVGIIFEGHPDLRRILLPGDWDGFPLRKDYEEQETYHGIKVKF